MSSSVGSDAETRQAEERTFLLQLLVFVYAELEAERKINVELRSNISMLQKKVEKLTATVRTFARMLFATKKDLLPNAKTDGSPEPDGESTSGAASEPAEGSAQAPAAGAASEQSESEPAAASAESTKSADSTESTPTGRRPRGQQRGSRGHGRRLHPELPSRIVLEELDEDQRRCGTCGTAYDPIEGEFEDSHLLDFYTELIENLYRRQKYRKACNCPNGADSPAFLIPPPVAKVIPKGKFSPRALAELCVDKYQLGLPLQRIALAMRNAGARISSGTLDGALQRVGELIHPLYDAIAAKVRESDRAHADETRFVTLTEGGRRLWWLWLLAAPGAVLYLFDPTRSADVMRRFFNLNFDGPLAGKLWTLIVDCYAAYKALGSRVRQAYCWAHIRRRILDVARGYDAEHLLPWAKGWKRRIAQLYRLHDERWRAPPESAQWREADERLRQHVRSLRATLTRQLNSPVLHNAARKVLVSMDKHWDGLTLFLDEPWLPLDNNLAERLLRGPVLCRKNYYVNGAEWAADLAACLWSIFATVQIYGINPVTYLTAYFTACARNGGRP